MKALIQEYLDDINYLKPGTTDIVDIVDYGGCVEVEVRNPCVPGAYGTITITLLELLCWLKGYRYD